MDGKVKPTSLLDCIGYGMSFANAKKYGVATRDYPWLDYARTMLQARLRAWEPGPFSPIPGADAAVKALAEVVAKPGRIAQLKAEIAKLEKELCALEDGR